MLRGPARPRTRNPPLPAGSAAPSSGTTRSPSVPPAVPSGVGHSPRHGACAPTPPPAGVPLPQYGGRGRDPDSRGRWPRRPPSDTLPRSAGRAAPRGLTPPLPVPRSIAHDPPGPAPTRVAALASSRSVSPSWGDIFTDQLTPVRFTDHSQREHGGLTVPPLGTTISGARLRGRVRRFAPIPDRRL